MGGVLGTSISGCSSSNSNQVIIYSSAEGERNETLMLAMAQDLPELDIRLHYMSTGNLAARLALEGESSEFDIALGLEAGYLLKCKNSLVDLKDKFDFSVFDDDLIIDSTILPFARESGCFAYNTEVLKAAGVEPPTSVFDLTDPKYKNLVCIPNPKASGTGYNFYYSMVNYLGEEDALEYFDKLAENVYQFTSSGSKPATALTQGEAGVGLSLIFELVSERNDGAPTELLMPDAGAAWTMVGTSVVKGHENKDAVWKVMQWLYDKGILLDKQEHLPDEVFKGQNTKVKGYPTNIKYADMTGLFDLERKERLLEAWKY